MARIQRSIGTRFHHAFGCAFSAGPDGLELRIGFILSLDSVGVVIDLAVAFVGRWGGVAEFCRRLN